MKQEKFFFKKRGVNKIKYKYKKEIILLVIIFSLITLLEMITEKNLNDNLKEINNMLNKIENEIRLSEYKEDDAKEIFYVWKKIYDVLALYIKHDDLDYITIEIVKLKINIQNKNKNQCLKNIEEIKFLVDNLNQKNKFDLKNIF